MSKELNVSSEVKYVGFYDYIKNETGRVSALSAINKMDYICDALNRAGCDVHIISPSWTKVSKRNRIYAKKTINVNSKKKLTICPSISGPSLIMRFIDIIFCLTWILVWMTINVKRSEKVVVYHSPWLSLPVRIAKHMKKFCLVLEVEEIYGQVWQINSILQKWEQKLLKAADYYIAVSEILAKKLGPRTKLVVYGNYLVTEQLYEKSFDKNINIIYAGMIDHTKGGAYNAIKCMNYLPGSFILHICGYGSEQCIAELKNQVENMNFTLGRTACYYYGIKTGVEFSKILESCHIAVNPQFVGQHMNSAFPSKILTYLSHNLHVVSTKIPSIMKSSLSSIIVFSEDDKPESIAKAILKVKLDPHYNSKDIIKKMDNIFVSEIQKFIGICKKVQ